MIGTKDLVKDAKKSVDLIYYFTEAAARKCTREGSIIS